MGAPVGNQNAAKGKKWTSAIERALQRRSGVDFAQALDAMAEKFIDLVEKGDLQSFKEFGDRIEGKPTQQIELQGDVTLTVSKTDAEL
jgi:hypothetical protein